MEQIQQLVEELVKELFGSDVVVEISRTDEQFGDFTTNVAMQLAGTLRKNPREIAELLAIKLRENSLFSQVTVAGPGFINFIVADAVLVGVVTALKQPENHGKQVLVEYGDPNPFKEMHLGHLYDSIAGDAIANLFAVSGADVKRISYHGDVGMQVAKAMWAMLKDAKVQELLQLPIEQLYEMEFDALRQHVAKTLSAYYAEGAEAFENPAYKPEIEEINQHIYKKDDPLINKLHYVGSKWSFGCFDLVFDSLGIRHSREGKFRYLESEIEVVGTRIVKENIGKVFTESQGAIVYEGEKKGLHTRVFINSKGLPTYEAKDLGLAFAKNTDYPEASRSIIITANEQSEYFKVMLAALEDIQPDLAQKTTHVAHGFLTLTTGKMSSRTGNVYHAQTLIDDTLVAVAKSYPDSAEEVQKAVHLAALKYTLLKHRLGSDIVFDVQESVSLEGNSGPYIQYAHARACSILAKMPEVTSVPEDFDPAERSLLRKISEYQEVVDRAVEELMPHHICTYLYELAQTFNRFYEKSRVIDDPRETTRLWLVKVYADTLQNGLKLLGISAPDKM